MNCPYLKIRVSAIVCVSPVNIANKDAYLNQRLDRLTKDLEISKEQLAKKRCERDAVNQTVVALKQEKAMLES